MRISYKGDNKLKVAMVTESPSMISLSGRCSKIGHTCTCISVGALIDILRREKDRILPMILAMEV